MTSLHLMTSDELKAIIRQCFRECFREEQETIRAAIREELKDAGLVLGDKDDNMAASEDFRFLRRTRVKFESASTKIGSTIILALVGGLIYLVVEGGKLLWGQR